MVTCEKARACYRIPSPKLILQKFLSRALFFHFPQAPYQGCKVPKSTKQGKLMWKIVHAQQHWPEEGMIVIFVSILKYIHLIKFTLCDRTEKENHYELFNFMYCEWLKSIQQISGSQTISIALYSVTTEYPHTHSCTFTTKPTTSRSLSADPSLKFRNHNDWNRTWQKENNKKTVCQLAH